MNDKTSSPTPEAARTQANSDLAASRNAPVMHTWHPNARDAYGAERARLEAERIKKQG